MFDPTAYENFKVILEGSIYDADFEGEIIVANRADIIDMAILSRKYAIDFVLKDDSSIVGSIVIHANLKQLALEILHNNENDAGAYVEIIYRLDQKEEPKQEHLRLYERVLHDDWGGKRNILTDVRNSYQNGVYHSTTIQLMVSFNRLIPETQANDLYELAVCAIQSLKHLISQKNKL